MNHDEHEHGENRLLSICFIAAGVVFTAASFFVTGNIRKALLICAAVICGIPVLKDAVEELKEKSIDESALLVIAACAAVIIGEYFEAAAVTVLFCIGELMEDIASDRSRKSIESLFGMISLSANRVDEDGSFSHIDAEEIRAGMKLAVFPHELIPADGIIYSGHGETDNSSLTGESIPVEVSEGSEIFSGCVNGNSILYFEATADAFHSSAARIANMVSEAAEDKGKAQSFIGKFAKYYTPAIIAAAVLLAVIPSIITREPREWVRRALILLVASCPCSIVLSAPLAFFSSMGACARNGMIIKGSRYTEALASADTAVFDKTGTLTTGKLTVGRIYTAGGFTEEKILELAAECEALSSHPIAKAITEKAGNPDMTDVTEIKEIPGGGTSAMTPEGLILCGGKKLMRDNGVSIGGLPEVNVYIALNGKAVGAIEITGETRPEAAKAVDSLKKLGIRRTVMLTGDSSAEPEKVCAECGIDEYHSGLLPEDKLELMKEIKASAKGVIYVGDGINDAPVLAYADVGTAMGLGTQAAAEAADLILTDSDLRRLPDTVYQSKRTMKVLKANIIFSVAVKLIVILLGIAGTAPMWSAVLADVGTMLICIINSAKLMKIKRLR